MLHHDPAQHAAPIPIPTIPLADIVHRNTADIATLSRDVATLVTLAQNAVQQRAEDVQSMREATASINVLKEKMFEALGVIKDVAQCREDIRVLRHDFKNHESNMPAMNTVKEKLEDMVKTVAVLHGVYQQGLGGAKVASWGGKAIWAIAGAGVLTLGHFLLKIYFHAPALVIPG